VKNATGEAFRSRTCFLNHRSIIRKRDTIDRTSIPKSTHWKAARQLFFSTCNRSSHTNTLGSSSSLSEQRIGAQQFDSRWKSGEYQTLVIAVHSRTRSTILAHQKLRVGPCKKPLRSRRCKIGNACARHHCSLDQARSAMLEQQKLHIGPNKKLRILDAARSAKLPQQKLRIKLCTRKNAKSTASPCASSY